MDLCLLWILLAGEAASAGPTRSQQELRSRQIDGDVSANTFLRRGFHSSAVLNGRVYIDGGEISFSSSSEGVVRQYQSNLLSIDLSQDFEPSNLVYTSIEKPPGAPNLRGGGLWVDAASNTLYNGFVGLPSSFGDPQLIEQGLWSFEPSEDGTTGTWTNLNDTADDYFTTERRHVEGSVASGGGAGFFLGGNLLQSNWDQTPVSGLLKYNFTTRVATNSTVVGTSTAGNIQRGQMHYVPNFGTNGILVAGGGQNGESGPLPSFSSVQVYDLATDTWYEQTTTGNYPDGRVGFCMTGAASSNKTYEIVVYAGYGGDLGSRAMSLDEFFVLSLPSFHWFKANYRASQPRHALTCEHLGGGQVLTIGGVDSSLYVQGSAYAGVYNTRDPHAQGLALFDLSLMSFSSGGYVSNRTVYNLAPEVQSYYDNNNRKADFSYAGLANTFAVEDFTSVATLDNNESDANTSSGSDASPTETTANPDTGSESSSGSNTGAIAGGVVGGVAGVALIGAAAFFILRRRKSKRAAWQQNNTAEGPEKTDFGRDGRGFPSAEMPGMMARRPEAEGSTPHVELPDTHRYELS